MFNYTEFIFKTNTKLYQFQHIKTRFFIYFVDIIQDVHLKGSFKTIQAAFPIFKDQGYGRVINTSSNSGLYG